MRFTVSLILGLVSVSTCLAFEFTLSSNNPVECGVIQVNWQGGTPPFSLTILVSFRAKDGVAKAC
jgi:hypothetical protein